MWCNSRRVFDLVKRSECFIASHERTNKTKQDKKNIARRLAWSVLLTPSDYVATSCKERNIINTASSFCCRTASRHTATTEQVTFPISFKRSLGSNKSPTWVTTSCTGVLSVVFWASSTTSKSGSVLVFAWYRIVIWWARLKDTMC